MFKNTGGSSIFDKFKGGGLFGDHGCGNDCCAPEHKCCAPAAKCCAPQACGEDSCCGSQKECLFDRMFKNTGGSSIFDKFKGGGGLFGDHGCGNDCCAPEHKCCAPAKKCCAPAAKCCAPQACGEDSCCDSQKSCSLGGGCSLWDKLKNGGGLFGNHGCGDDGCCETRCCDADPCEIAKLIYTSQTACYACDRRRAVDDLGDYDCVCNPEVMVALVYALNDADEKVRAEAADEIGDLLRANRCCCSKEVTEALTSALRDCDWHVRHQAEEALEACGYEVVDGCCNSCGSCDACDGGSVAPMPEQKHDGGATPAPAPPEDPKAYFPRRLQEQQSNKPSYRKNRLANLFGLLD